MAAERVIRRTGGFGIGGVLIGMGVMALVAVVVFVLASTHRDKAMRTDAVTSAASSLAVSTQAALD
ncbi:MAG: hypothetical protein JWP35_997 [Caulobacter sp.]|jgi:hypothetical protein|nr:hypothetical protein [Caulobacter sp.]